MNGRGRTIPARADRAVDVPIALVGEFEQVAALTTQNKLARDMSQIVRNFLWTQGVNQPSQLTVAAVERYLAGVAARGRSPKTLMNHRSAISGFCRFLKTRRLLDSNPCRLIRLPRPEREPPRWLDEKEMRTILDIARRQEIWPEVSLALSTGLRLSEMIRLKWPDIDFRRQCLTVRKSKSHRPRVVPLARPAVIALRMQRRKIRSTGLQPVSNDAQVTNLCHWVFPARQTWSGGWRYIDKPRASNWWRRALHPIQDAVGKFRELPGSSTGRGWHLFRHTFASRAAQAGVSLYKLAQWMGHSDIRTTQIYAHLQAGYDPEIEKAAPPESPPRRVDQGWKGDER